MTGQALEGFQFDRITQTAVARTVKRVRQLKRREIGVYRITCLENGMVYIGSSRRIQGRFVDHLRELRNGTHVRKDMVRDFIEYGERAFTFEVIESYTSENEARRRELALILELARNGRGYNRVTSEACIKEGRTGQRLREGFRQARALKGWMEHNSKTPADLAAAIRAKETRARLIMSGALPRLDEVRAISAWTNGEVGKNELLPMPQPEAAA